MRHPWFLFGAIVLIVFAIIASAMTTGLSPYQLFGVQWYSWLAAALLSYFVHLLALIYSPAYGRSGQPGA